MNSCTCFWDHQAISSCTTMLCRSWFTRWRTLWAFLSTHSIQISESESSMGGTNNATSKGIPWLLMSPNLWPATCDRKSQLMELSDMAASGSGNAPHPPPMPLVLPLADAHLYPFPAQIPKLALFQQLMLTIKNSDAMKKCLSLQTKTNRHAPTVVNSIFGWW